MVDFLFFIYVHDPFDESPRFTSLDDHDPYISPAHYFPTRLTHYSLLRTWPLFFFFFFLAARLSFTCACTWKTR